MKKTVKFLLTSILAVTSLGLVSVNIKDVKNGFVESTNDVAGEKINVGKKNAKSTATTDDFVVGKSVRVTNAVAQRRNKDNAIRFVAAAKADNLAEGIIGGDLGFHVRYAKGGTTVNKYVAVDSVYKSMVAGETTFTNDKMGDFLVSTGLGEASNPNGYNVFITYSIIEIPSDQINTEFEVQPFFLKTGEETREFAPGSKKANATGHTLKVGDGNTVSLQSCEKGDEYQTAQYKATITADAGKVVTFYVDGKKLTTNINIKSEDTAKCNVSDEGNGNFKIRTAVENQEIYLKQYGDWYNVWIAGYNDGGDTPISEVTTLYLKPNTNWNADGARFAAYFFNDSGYNTWADLELIGDNIYKVEITSEAKANNVNTVIFCRMNPKTTENNWGNKWNQTDNIDIPLDSTKALFEVKEGTWDKGGGEWKAYPEEAQ